jgi:general secretion pathway protein G
MMTKRKNSGFTLVEILIVVVILGILAAIVIPQFSQASSEARESSLKSNLQAIRSQIELYRIQHNDLLPAEGALEAALTTKTDIDGVLWVSGVGYGPYMKTIPVNPFTNAAVIAAASDAAGGAVDWVYDITGTGVNATYDFVADDWLDSATGENHEDY